MDAINEFFSTWAFASHEFSWVNFAFVANYFFLILVLFGILTDTDFEDGPGVCLIIHIILNVITSFFLTPDYYVFYTKIFIFIVPYLVLGTLGLLVWYLLARMERNGG